MKVMVVGSGGREHALGWAVRRALPSTELLFCPGNGGTAALGRNLPGSAGDLAALASMAETEKVDLTLIGPEAPLAAGVVDLFRARGLRVFGPTAAAAAIESSKVFTKTLLQKHGIPSAAFTACESAEAARQAIGRGNFPIVLKADGLAAGKGVVIAANPAEAEQALDDFFERRTAGAAGERVVVEEFLEGEEVSVFALCRGQEFRLLPFSQDHKRIGEGDQGPNTGGMGAYAPYPGTSADLVRRIESRIIAPTLAAMEAEGRTFSGLLYAGLMLVRGEPMVLEYNCRFGDPETQAVLPLLGGGFVEALAAVAEGREPIPPVTLRTAGPEAAAGPGNGALHAATVVLAAPGYPGSYPTGMSIRGVEEAEAAAETLVFHAGTARREGLLVAVGGRVLAVTGCGGTLPEALERAYRGAGRIEFDGKYVRRDIGWRALR